MPECLDEDLSLTHYFCKPHASYQRGSKATVKDILQSFGWQDAMTLGDVSSSLAVEMQMPIWLKACGVLGQTHFNFKIIRQIQI